jgi:hypothetical protein
MKRTPDFFGDQELVLIYVAKKLREAKKVELALTNSGVDYIAGTDTYRGGFIFQTERVGVFFYVVPEDEVRAQAVLAGSGYRSQKTSPAQQ